MNDLELCLEVVSRSCQSLRLALHSTLNISETVTDSGAAGSKGPPISIGNGIWAIKWSRKMTSRDL